MGWNFAHVMAKVCSDQLKANTAKAKFILIRVDEMTAMDNLQLLSIQLNFSC